MRKILVGLFALSLSILNTACDRVGGEEVHTEAEGVKIMQGTTTLVTVREGVVTGSLTAVVGVTGVELKAVYLDASGNEIAVANIEEGSSTGVTWIDTAKGETIIHDAWRFHLKGKVAGATNVKIDLLHQGHSDFTTPAIPVSVSNSSLAKN